MRLKSRIHGIVTGFYVEFSFMALQRGGRSEKAYSLVHDNTDGIIEERLAEDDSV